MFSKGADWAHCVSIVKQFESMEKQKDWKNTIMSRWHWNRYWVEGNLSEDLREISSDGKVLKRQIRESKTQLKAQPNLQHKTT